MNREDQARALFEQGEACYDDGLYDEAIENLHRLLDEFEEIIDIGGVHYWLGCGYYRKGVYDNALSHLKQAYDHIDRAHMRPGDLHTLYYLALTYYAQDQSREALTYLNEAEPYFHLYDEAENWMLRFDFRTLKGNIYLWLKEPLLAADEYRMAHDYMTSGNQQHSALEADIHRLLGRAYLHADDLGTADQYMQRVDTSHLSRPSLEAFYLDMEILRGRQKRYREALYYFDKLREIGIPEMSMSEAYSFAAEAHFHLGDGPNARACLQEALRHDSHAEWFEEYVTRLQRRLEQAGF